MLQPMRLLFAFVYFVLTLAFALPRRAASWLPTARRRSRERARPGRVQSAITAASPFSTWQRQPSLVPVQRAGRRYRWKNTSQKLKLGQLFSRTLKKPRNGSCTYARGAAAALSAIHGGRCSELGRAARQSMPYHNCTNTFRRTPAMHCSLLNSTSK